MPPPKKHTKCSFFAWRIDWYGWCIGTSVPNRVHWECESVVSKCVDVCFENKSTNDRCCSPPLFPTLPLPPLPSRSVRLAEISAVLDAITETPAPRRIPTQAEHSQKGVLHYTAIQYGLIILAALSMHFSFASERASSMKAQKKGRGTSQKRPLTTLTLTPRPPEI